MKIAPVGHALSLFLLISYALCLAWSAVMPIEWHMHAGWEAWLPGFDFDSPATWLLGAAEVYAYGWYIAFIFVLLYRYFARRADV